MALSNPNPNPNRQVFWTSVTLEQLSTDAEAQYHASIAPPTLPTLSTVDSNLTVIPQVKVVYRKAIRLCHPDKLTWATPELRQHAAMVFDRLKKGVQHIAGSILVSCVVCWRNIRHLVTHPALS